MAKCELCGKKMWFEVPYKIDGKSLCSECAQGESKKKQEVEELGNQPQQILPIPPEEIQKIEFQTGWENQIIVSTIEGSQKFRLGLFKNNKDIMQFPKTAGLNKWELKFEGIDNGEVTNFICKRGEDFGLVYQPRSPSAGWFIYLAGVIAYNFVYYIKLIRLGESQFGLMLMLLFSFFPVFICFKELILFGDINARWFLSYPKTILNSKGVEYIRNNTITFIPWEDIVFLRHSIIGVAALTLGVTIFTNDGKKFVIPIFSTYYDEILVDTIAKYAGLAKMNSPSSWFKKWIAGDKWGKKVLI